MTAKMSVNKRGDGPVAFGREFARLPEEHQLTTSDFQGVVGAEFPRLADQEAALEAYYDERRRLQNQRSEEARRRDPEAKKAADAFLASLGKGVKQ